MSSGPPGLAQALLRVLLPRAVRDEAIDELADLYHLRASRGGNASASHWYWRQLVGYALSLRVAYWRGHLPDPQSVSDRRRGAIMGGALSDVRYGARSLLRSPGFAAIAVLTLGLGIGANASIFSVVRSVLLRPLPFPEPNRLVELWEAHPDRGFTNAGFAHANFWDLRDLNRSLEAVGALEWTSLTLTGLDHPERLGVARVSVGFLRALGVAPVAGRIFAEGEDAPGAAGRTVVLGHSVWRNQFGADRAVVGRTLTLDGQGYQVIGVLPSGTPWLDAAELFVPLVQVPGVNRGSFELSVVGRLRPGITLEAADADLQSVGRRIGQQHAETRDLGVTIASSDTWVAPDTLRRALWVLMGAVGFLLLIACVNLANLLLARASDRSRERAVRTVLGASRARLLQLALSESALVGVLGGGLGITIAIAVVRWLRALDPGIPRLAETTVDWQVLSVTLAAALASSLLTGLVPALRAPMRDMVTTLRESERSVVGNRRAGRLRSTLVGLEVALSLILLVGAGLLVRSFAELLTVDRGFRTENRLLFDVGLPRANSEEEGVRRARMLVDLHERIRALPGVSAAAAVSMMPLRGVGTGMGFAAGDKAPPPDSLIPWASWRRITSDYFRSMGVPLLAGRDFTEQDQVGEGRPWRVIISRSIAELLWPGENAVGRPFILWKGQGELRAEVIGVAGNMRDWNLDNDPSLAVYLPYYGGSSSTVNFVVNAAGPTAGLTAPLRNVLAEVDPNLPISNLQSLDEMVGASVAARRFTMLMLVALALIALLLALAGVYGVLTFVVSRRRSEMGMRMALGASAASVLRLVMLQGMRPVAIGLAVGVAGALALSRVMTGLLFGVTPLDLPTYGAVALLLVGAAALSCYLPARAATRVNPLTALREE